jgi:succinate dehydrogenase/fumarate reductase-like Fe-S protein
MIIDRIGAIVYLGIYFVLHWVRRIRNLRNPVDGYNQFLENFSEDRLLPMGRDDYRRQEEFARCINCGFCSTAGDHLAELKCRTNCSPAMIASAASRSQPEFWAAVEIAEIYADRAGDWEKVCPRGVPIADALKYIIEKAVDRR